MRQMYSLLVLLALVGCGGPDRGHAGLPRPQGTGARAPVGAGTTAVLRAPSAVEIDHGPRSRPWIALTFDADMTHAMLARLRSGAQRSWYAAPITRTLRATHTPATIFLTGLWTRAYPGIVRQLARDPLFELDNHSVDHSGWLAPCYGLPVVRSVPSKRDEIDQAAATIRSVAGVLPRYFRFPGGCHDASDLRLVAAAGEQAVGWDVVSGDPFEPSPAVVEQNVLRGARPGSIVVMHIVGAPNAPATARALPVIIAKLRARGFRFVTLRRLLGAAHVKA